MDRIRRLDPTLILLMRFPHPFAGAVTANLLAYVCALWSMFAVVSKDGQKVVSGFGSHSETMKRTRDILNWMASADHCPSR